MLDPASGPGPPPQPLSLSLKKILTSSPGSADPPRATPYALEIPYLKLEGGLERGLERGLVVEEGPSIGAKVGSEAVLVWWLGKVGGGGMGGGEWMAA